MCFALVHSMFEFAQCMSDALHWLRANEQASTHAGSPKMQSRSFKAVIRVFDLHPSFRCRVRAAASRAPPPKLCVSPSPNRQNPAKLVKLAPHRRLWPASSRFLISSMKGSVLRYWSGVTLGPCAQIARSCGPPKTMRNPPHEPL